MLLRLYDGESVPDDDDWGGGVSGGNKDCVDIIEEIGGNTVWEVDDEWWCLLVECEWVLLLCIIECINKSDMMNDIECQ